MKNILVTGGAGFIGSHTCIALLEEGSNIYVIDSYENSSPKSVERVLSKGIRTADLLQKDNQKPSSTKEVCNEILDELNLQL